jgi:hypothetical protein
MVETPFSIADLRKASAKEPKGIGDLRRDGREAGYQ